MLQSGISLDMIRDFLGHVDVKTTQIYARANLEMKRQALEKITDPSPVARSHPGSRIRISLTGSVPYNSSKDIAHDLSEPGSAKLRRDIMLSRLVVASLCDEDVRSAYCTYLLSAHNTVP